MSVAGYFVLALGLAAIAWPYLIGRGLRRRNERVILAHLDELHAGHDRIAAELARDGGELRRPEMLDGPNAANRH